MQKQEYSEYVVYADESGHSSSDLDPNYPCFVLALCLFKKDYYCQKLAPALQELKFRFFGHDMVILHEREIRKSLNSFSILKDEETRNLFHKNLNDLIEKAKFSIISHTILKDRKSTLKQNLYHVATQQCLEELYETLKQEKQHEKLTHIVFEERGKNEDRQLELEFRRICSGENYHQQKYSFEPIFASKKANSSGLQFADLTARPIGLAALKPQQNNRAYEIIKMKKFSPSLEQPELNLPPEKQRATEDSP